ANGPNPRRTIFAAGGFQSHYCVSFSGCWEAGASVCDHAVGMLGTIQKITVAAMFMWTAAPRPELPYFDWDACPFEGCAYKQWTAKEAIPVYDTWKGDRRKIESLKAGDKVMGVTGVVITYRPGRIRIDKDRPEDKLKRGDIVWTYTYQGEGTFKA